MNNQEKKAYNRIIEKLNTEESSVEIIRLSQAASTIVSTAGERIRLQKWKQDVQFKETP